MGWRCDCGWANVLIIPLKAVIRGVKDTIGFQGWNS